MLWGVGSYLALSQRHRGTRTTACRRACRRLLTHQNGLLSSTPTTILVLGTDGGEPYAAGLRRHSDSIMLVRTDPEQHRIVLPLDPARSAASTIPGYGTDKINAAFQFGGPTLALRTMKELTGLDVNHVAFVDFAKFKELIDAVGGIDVDVPKPILSNRFDCPYATPTRCNAWPGWRFAKGKQHMNGQRALDLLAHPREQARSVGDRLRPRRGGSSRSSRRQARS